MGLIFTQIFSWLLRSVIMKFVVFTIFYFIVSEFGAYLISKLSFLTPAQFNSSLSALTPEMWFFIDILKVDVGLPMIISAYLLRFSIRRMPVIG